MNHYNIIGEIDSSNKNMTLFFYIRLKDDLSISDIISSQDRVQTYSDGVLSINNIQPLDHGSYVCIISTSNSTSIRSKPAVITVKCKFNFYLVLKLRRREFRSTKSFAELSNKKSHINSRFDRYMSMFTGCLSANSIGCLVSKWRIYSD